MWVHKQLHMMGTIIDLQLQHPEASHILKETIQQLIAYEHWFSANNPTSELMQINNAAGKEKIRVRPELFELIQLGVEHSIPSDSFLNIAIGALTREWRIGFSDAKILSQDMIDFLLTKIDVSSIKLDREQQTVFLEDDMSIDLGALAKGYIADMVVHTWKEQGATAGLINLGGNILTFGTPPNTQREYWRIGIQAPLFSRNTYETLLRIKDKSIVTSGIYERFLETDSQVYHHILNPHTGLPVETAVQSLTIISDTSVDGEIWTTRLFGHPPAKILNVINSLEHLEGIIITETETFYSQGMKEFL